MKLSDFDYFLPEELIAQHPPATRGQSRLLVAHPGCPPQDHAFDVITELLLPGDLLVLNDTKVVKARLFGEKASGGKIEIMVERMVDHRRFTAMIRASKSPKPGGQIILPGGTAAQVIEKNDMLYTLELAENAPLLDDILNTHGHLPLPPYITHEASPQDEARYQTVFAREPGAVAAPTAGLHFTDELLAKLCTKGVNQQTLTLHVGAGTFLPVKQDDVSRHTMHRERYAIGPALVDALVRTKQAGKRVVAVGTTSLRALEAFASELGADLNLPDGQTKALSLANQGHRGDTDIFITPGFEFKAVDALITNFHLPKSTLLMLVSALAGREEILRIYAHAVEKKYRFFSYGDAMWLDKKPQ